MVFLLLYEKEEYVRDRIHHVCYMMNVLESRGLFQLRLANVMPKILRKYRRLANSVP